MIAPNRMRILGTVFAVVLAAAPCCQDPAPAEERRPFSRLIERPDGGQLDVLVATYRKGDVELVLHGSIHVADAEHYVELQRRFDAFEVLLYEMVGDPEDPPHPGLEYDYSGDFVSLVQSSMGRGLMLAMQMEHIDYRRPHFVHADFTAEQFEEALARNNSSLLGELFSGTPAEPDRDAEAKAGKQDLVAAFRSGRGAHEMRLLGARLLSEPEAARQRPTVLIEGRNERCLDVLAEQLAAGKRSIGIYYGAAHMEHMERRLLQDLGWRRTGEEWLMAWDNRASRFPVQKKGEQQRRYRARTDLDALTELLDSWTRENLSGTPTIEGLRRANGGTLPGRGAGADPWGAAFALRDEERSWHWRSAGPDGAFDTEDDVVGDDVAKPRPSVFLYLARALRKQADAARAEADALLPELTRTRGGIVAGAASFLRERHGKLPTFADVKMLLAVGRQDAKGSKVWLDGWERPFRILDDGNRGVVVVSDGADGKPDTADDLRIVPSR